MGAYLSAPVTAKESEDAECEWLRCGASSMQGWRRSMEDAHVNGATVGGDARFFGVFDGHGGAEVARFTARHIAEALPNDWNADASRALKALFHEMDSRLRLADNSAELTSLKNAAAGVARAPPRAAVDDAAVGTASDEDRQSAKKEAFALFSQVLATTKATQRDATDGEQGGAPRDGAAALAAANRAELANAGQESVAPGERRRCTLPDYAFSAGCAAVVVVAERTEGGLSRLWCANAGDSRAVVSRNGLAFGLSEDHKPNDSGERYRIDNAGGFVECANGFYRVNGNLNLSRSLGDLKYKQNAELRPEEQIISADPDVLAYDVNSDDEFFILACDGIWDVCSNQDAVDFVRKRLDELKAQGGHVKLSQICEDLFDFCLAKNPRETRGIGGDNMTVIIVEFNRV
ncbi:phosphatase 2C-like domain-containing protein [Pelagophyceae sp. CCMP2097]|nr:phosphatase 2C-like domain-containing protein [Pelagophyceae sp. CCMP2097]|mmetsp:Transcript_27070/g.96691  ORF Transcript_27070/g.96691 Transcript_27070/m.96691 type:complete len:405 (+) Transcript_27070:699-1913(+)